MATKKVKSKMDYFTKNNLKPVFVQNNVKANQAKNIATTISDLRCKSAVGLLHVLICALLGSQILVKYDATS